MNMVVAMNKNGVIGNENSLPWNLHNDLKTFRNITRRSVVVMGRKTYESIGKPLPGRVNVIISRDKTYDYGDYDDVFVLQDLEDVEKVAEKYGMEINIIGGAEIYRRFYDECTSLYLTLVEDEEEGDTSVDFIDFDDWYVYESYEHKKDEKNSHDFKFFIMERRKENETVEK